MNLVYLSCFSQRRQEGFAFNIIKQSLFLNNWKFAIGFGIAICLGPTLFFALLTNGLSRSSLDRQQK